ncbi:hypothetical protein BRADI_1g26945v3 [Brachypodium distachyon]|uniref:Uncharacterized protein n=1 Tax=Brachypodium distachyon TaxID=15368 RepID=A0A0Q3RSS9_BRADI|nr:hypothetical protein BRADI_1g26945v3 [Brachypodium distachyon]
MGSTIDHLVTQQLVVRQIMGGAKAPGGMWWSRGSESVMRYMWRVATVFHIHSHMICCEAF